MSDAPRFLHPDDCKHIGEDALIVQRNNGVRWVSCTVCQTDFVNAKFLDRALEAITQHRDAFLNGVYTPAEKAAYQRGERDPDDTNHELWSVLDEPRFPDDEDDADADEGGGS